MNSRIVRPNMALVATEVTAQRDYTLPDRAILGRLILTVVIIIVLLLTGRSGGG